MTDLGARYAVCEGVLRQGSFASDVALARAAGIGAIGVDAAAADEIGAEEAARILDGEGLRASSYLPLEDILQAGAGTASRDETARRLDVVARVAAPAALIGTGALGTRRVSDADAVCREWLTDASKLAVERGVQIMLEPMHPLMRRWSYVHTLTHALSLVDGIAGIGVVLDLGHVWWERDLEATIAEHVDRIVSVQVTNIDRAALEAITYERTALDAGDVPVAALIRTLEAAGYRGWYENEVLARIPRAQRLDALRASREWFEALDPGRHKPVGG